MTKHKLATGLSPSSTAQRQEFDYHHAPRAGLNWPFAQQLIMSGIVWSTVAVSVAFWGCLVVDLIH